MLVLLLPLLGFAFLDSLNVLNLGVMALIVYDGRLSRRSPLPAGLCFAAGLYFATTTFGVAAVLGLAFLTERIDFELTPTIRFWGQLALGFLLIALAAFSSGARGPKPPTWAFAAARRNPWLFGVVGLVIGYAQAATAVPYLTALTMISARHPLPAGWPFLVLGYCALTLVPALLILALSTSRSARVQRAQRTIVRTLTRYGPPTIRILFLIVGVGLVGNALWRGY